MKTGLEGVALSRAAKKDRHIVSWSSKEDELLREQVSSNGANNWTAIASLFKDKTARQCKRRWYTYLSSECKKGGWSAEEDMILCEAQKMFGNRWTEIAKVVSGRTDNAVKNRFSTLCRKRAKLEASLKENNELCSKTGASKMGESSTSFRIRHQGVSHTKAHAKGDGSEEKHSQPPLAEVVQNLKRLNEAKDSGVMLLNEVPTKTSGGFLKRDDPKISALLQQAELLSSLAMKVNNRGQSLDDAWKELHDYLIQKDDGATDGSISCMLAEFQDFIEDIQSSSLECMPLMRKDNSINCSRGSFKPPESQPNTATPDLHRQHGECSSKQNHEVGGLECDPSAIQGCEAMAIMSPSEEQDLHMENIVITSNLVFHSPPNLDFSSPLEMIPPFLPFSDRIPTPKLSESERNFIVSILRMPSPIATPNSSQKPSCKRALLNSL